MPLKKNRLNENLDELISKVYSLLEKNPELEKEFSEIVCKFENPDQLITTLSSFLKNSGVDYLGVESSKDYSEHFEGILKELFLGNPEDLRRFQEMRKNFRYEMGKFNPRLRNDFCGNSFDYYDDIYAINCPYDAYFIIKFVNGNYKKSEIAGYFLCLHHDENEVEIAKGYVIPSFRREGLFTLGLEKIINKYRNEHKNVIAFVYEKNKTPQKVLKKLGFEESNKEENGLIKFFLPCMH